MTRRVRRLKRAGHGRRRGTVLVLVLGVLALVAVLTLAYVSVGQADRRTGATLIRTEAARSAAEQVADYIARVIGDAALAVYVDGETTGASGDVLPVLVRRAADHPWTDPALRSMPGNNPARRFNPTGSYDQLWSGSGADPRRPSSPYLAATFPTGTDWDHISLFSPDGRAVNLWNLAPVIGGVRRSGFDARSGWTGTAPPPPAIVNGEVVSNISYGLALLDGSGNPMSPAAGDYNTPATWSVVRRNLFRPAQGPVFYPGNAAANRPDHEWYAPYQFCDADGDGFFDSVWIELIDASDPDNPRPLIATDGRYRWFVAIRAVDLSALVNVNTATDFREPPRPPDDASERTPLGLVPEVDLRRKLTLDDEHRRLGYDGYAELRQPVGGGREDYSGYDASTARTVGALGYNALRLALRREHVAVPAPWAPVGNVPAMTADERALYYLELSGRPRGGVAPGSTSFVVQSHGRFGLADLCELLTFRTANAPPTSRLEQTLGGRLNPFNGGSAATEHYSPLRDSRGLDLELWTNDPYLPGQAGPGSWDQYGQARAEVDLRQYLTTVNGARPLRAGIVPDASYRGLLTTADVRVDAVAALRAATRSDASLRDPSLVFSGYADALLPHSFRAGAWDASPGARLRTLHYGYSAERALRVAAHLTANQIDSYDENHEPTAATLLIDAAFRGSLGSSNPQYPWWSEPGAGSGPNATWPGRLDLGDDRLGNTSRGDLLAARAVNVYGIEAQPFIVEAASYLLYTDTPAARGGDQEWPGPGFPPPFPPITLNGTFGHVDTLGQVLAFQITNPFDVEVRLSGSRYGGNQSLPDNDYSDFYVEYAGRYYKLAERQWDPATGQLAPELRAIVLAPGETRVFYALSHPPAQMIQRWRQIEPALSPTALWEFLDFQLGVVQRNGQRHSPVLIQRMDPATGTTLTDTADLFNDPSGQPAASRRVVLLWRALRSAGIDPPGDVNDRSNDLLADRLRDPGPPGLAVGATLDRRLPASNQNIIGTQAGEEPPGGPSLDNTGFTIVLWGSVKRRDDPGDPATGTVPLGAVPAWCVEAKWGSGVLANRSRTEGANPAGLKKTDFITGNHGDTTFLGLMTRITGGGAGGEPNPAWILVPTMTQRPDQKSGDPIGLNLGGTGYSALYPEIYLNNNRYEETVGVPSRTLSVLRVTDMLLPLAVGPVHDPAVSAGDPSEPDPIHPGWLTLSEALALALDYSRPPAGLPPNDPYSPYVDFGVAGSGMVDRANLVLTRFVPFEDLDGDGVFDPDEPRRFPGVPLAMNVLNVFTTADPSLADGTRAMPGVVNINTAPRAVVDLLPLLAPTTEPGVWQQWKNRAGLGSSTLPDTDWDISTALVAYRDRLRWGDRNGDEVNFTDTPTQTGRIATTGIAGLREDPGFGIVGEILAITGSDSSRLPENDRIDRLGRDGFNSGSRGTNTTAYRDDSTVPPTTRLDGIADNYAEQLIVAAGLMNSIAVRSDVFAVWFVLHGYQRSDTENLHPRYAGDPVVDALVPSVARRYLMVVDRSNVTRVGERPRVLLFTELPLTGSSAR